MGHKAPYPARAWSEQIVCGRAKSRLACAGLPSLLMPRRRRPSKPLIPGLRWLLLLLLLLGLIFGVYGLLAHWTHFERVQTARVANPPLQDGAAVPS